MKEDKVDTMLAVQEYLEAQGWTKEEIVDAFLAQVAWLYSRKETKAQEITA